jgi:hypothetical protein
MKAYVDTTILADVLLNSGQVKKDAQKALAAYDSSSLAVYAIKEFKAGPLHHFAYIHNKLVTTKSFQLSLQVLQKLSRTPRRNQLSTSIQAIVQGLAKSLSKYTTTDLAEKYPSASLDYVQYDELRLAISGIISRAWKRRRKVTSEIVDPLTCYRESAPYMDRDMIVLDSCECAEEHGCCLGRIMQKNPEALSRMRESIKSSPKPENQRRSKVLREMIRKPKEGITNKDCRHLGDAVFVFFAPSDSVILTTNIQDFKPLADALGKTVARP